MEQKIFIKTSDEQVICINDVITVSVPTLMNSGAIKREVTLTEKIHVWISEEDYWELEKVMRDNMLFFLLKKEKVENVS